MSKRMKHAAMLSQDHKFRAALLETKDNLKAHSVTESTDSDVQKYVDWKDPRIYSDETRSPPPQKNKLIDVHAGVHSLGMSMESFIELFIQPKCSQKVVAFDVPVGDHPVVNLYFDTATATPPSV